MEAICDKKNVILIPTNLSRIMLKCHSPYTRTRPPRTLEAFKFFHLNDNDAQTFYIFKKKKTTMATFICDPSTVDK